MLPTGPTHFVPEHFTGLEEVYGLVLCMLPSEFRRGEVAQKTGVVGTASVDPNDRSKGASIVAALTKFAFDGLLLAGRLLVDSGVELTCSPD